METNTMAGLFSGLFPQLTDGKLGDGLDLLSGAELGLDQQSFVDILQGLDPSQIIQAAGAADSFINPDLLLNNGENPGAMANIELTLTTIDSEALGQQSGNGLPQNGNAAPLAATLTSTSQTAATALQGASATEAMAKGAQAPLTDAESEALLAGKQTDGVVKTAPLSNSAATQSAAAVVDAAQLEQQTRAQAASVESAAAKTQQQVAAANAQQMQSKGPSQPVTHQSLTETVQQATDKQGATSKEPSGFIGLKPLQTTAQPMAGNMGAGSGGESFQGQGSKADVITSQMLAMERNQSPEQRFTLAPVAGTPSTPTTAAPVQLEVSTPVGSAGWDKAFNQQIMMMANRDVQAARIQLNPQNLGPISVELSMSDEKSSVLFHAKHDTTRDAIEQALPRLRAMFESQGMQLSDAQVSDTFNEQEQTDAFRERLSQQQNQGEGQSSEEPDNDESTVVIQRQVDEDDGLLDHYV